MAQPVVHVEVVGQDPDRLRDFFGQLFAWEWSDPMGPTNYATIANAEGVGGGIGDGPEGYPGHVTFYVQVPDVEATLAQAESLGGSRMMGPEKMTEVGIVIGLMSDPEGHVIGLMTPIS
jgi:predicted enzyme related to lactoylglutathione lyase